VLSTAAAAPLDDTVVDRYRDVLRIPFAAHSSVEAVRWLTRAPLRPDGRRYLAALRQRIDVPVLQVHGGRDGLLRRDGAEIDGAAMSRRFRFEVLDDAGHLLAEEAPDQVTDLLSDWLRSVLDIS
jgi:pimeloyl-ACP methyl ester carboxylesterase